MMSDSFVSIIIPVYKVATTIERCARSLFAQSLENIEYVFVNDCSPDNSICILESVLLEFPNRLPWVKVLNNSENKGISHTRNIGLQNATGEYLIQVDSDDWIETTMLEELYTIAKAEDADMVYCDFWVDYLSHQPSVYRTQQIENSPTACIQAMLVGQMHGATWNKLIKRSLVTTNHIEFPKEINMCEDLYFNISFLIDAVNVIYLPKAFYHYMQNEGSITLNIQPSIYVQQIDLIQRLELMLDAPKYEHALRIYKWRIKAGVFFSGLFSIAEFEAFFPELNASNFAYTGSSIDKMSLRLALKRRYFWAKLLNKLAQLLSVIKKIIANKQH